MKNLLNLGVSNPLTLGMAHPVADRLETLGRARPATWRSRCLALSAMGVIALASAPLSIAADHPEHDHETRTQSRFKFISSFDGKKGQSYEIVTEDGVKKAYRILEGGDRKEVGLTKKEDGAYKLTYDDGQTVDLPNIDLEKLGGLKGLAKLKNLEGLEGLKALESLEGLYVADGLDGVEFSTGNVRVRSFDGIVLDEEESTFLERFPETVREKLLSKHASKTIKVSPDGKILQWINKEGEEGEGVPLQLEDTVISSSFEFFHSSDPLSSARRQLERTKRQLESLSDEENLSFDLKNALRDIESAQKSLKEAEARLLDETD